jgi:hypothetical protein
MTAMMVFMFILNYNLIFPAGGFSKHRFPTGDDPEQNRYNGEDEENVNQTACGAGD